MRGKPGTAMPIEERRAQKRAYMVKWRAEHPDYMKRYAKTKYKKYGDRYKQYARKDCLKKKYGITLEDYDEMFEIQKGVCAICAAAPKRYRLAVDHCHKTGKVRQLLCSYCNISLAVLENTEFLAKAAKYLEDHAPMI